MLRANKKNTNSKFRHDKDKFSMEAGREIGVDLSNANITTAKIIYAYELGLKDRI